MRIAFYRVGLLFLALQIADSYGLWWVVGRHVVLDVRRVCRRARRLRGLQSRMCKREQQVVREVLEGAREGMLECQHQLRNHRWNCTTARRSLGKMLLKDTRESAFVQAITASAAAHRVAEACLSSALLHCPCTPGHKSRTQDIYFQGGCKDHNVNYGCLKSAQFLDTDDSRYRDIRSKLLRHNNEVGRLAIRNNMENRCKCHGLSGSCELKTCWKRIPKFRQTGQLLLNKFKEAKEVAPGNDGKSFFWSDSNRYNTVMHRRSIPQDHLVFMEPSPNFCQRAPKLGVLGPKGRRCHMNSSVTEGNCEHLCCGRGFEAFEEMRQYNCSCKFEWCCEVKCRVCTQNSTTYFCN